MRHVLIAALVVAAPAAAQPAASPSAADGWLQARLDRISASARRGAGAPEIRVVEDSRLRFAPDKTGRLQLSKAALRLAPDSRAVDGLLALMLSYSARLPISRAGQSVPGSVIAGAAYYGALAADNQAYLPDFPDEALMEYDAAIARYEANRHEARIAAARALDWAAKSGGCRAATVDYLRVLATSPTLDGRVARRVLDDLGPAVNDPDNDCPTPADPSFAAVKASLTSPAAAVP
jgi:hypothetical protein